MGQTGTDDEDLDMLLPDELPDEQAEAVEEIGRLGGGGQGGLDWQCTGRGDAVEGGVYVPQADVYVRW